MTFGGPACKIQKVRKQIETHFSTITDVTASREIHQPVSRLFIYSSDGKKTTV